MVKAVFFDVDGTLISHRQKIVPESTRSALEKLSEKGIKRILATGRHMIELNHLPVRDISFDGYILLNGQLCLDAQGNILSENPITGAAKEQILALFREATVPMMLVEKDRLYINFVNPYVESAQEAISTPVPDISDYTGNEIYQVVAFVDRDREKLLSPRFSGCRVTRWNDHAIDIVAASGGKAAGIQAYLKQNHIKREETMAFGDGENDMEMLQYVQIGVAMGNAAPAVKEIADHVTDSVDDEGILAALSALGILL